MSNTQTDHSKMVRALVKDPLEIAMNMTKREAGLIHMVIGISGEVAELIASRTLENTVEELGDTEFYLEGMRQLLHLDRGMILRGPVNPCIHLEWKLRLVIFGGDLLDAVKKHAIYKKTLDLTMVIPALASIERELEACRRYNNIYRGTTLEHNLNKLLKGKNARYKEGKFSNEQAQERADKENEDG